MLGSGWCWLLHDQHTDRLLIVSTANGASPLIHRGGSLGGVSVSPVLGLDLWEAAYVLDFGVERDKYIRAWWDYINWHRISVLLG